MAADPAGLTSLRQPELPMPPLEPSTTAVPISVTPEGVRPSLKLKAICGVAGRAERWNSLAPRHRRPACPGAISIIDRFVCPEQPVKARRGILGHGVWPRLSGDADSDEAVEREDGIVP